ncbi:L,D-transpeptidase family protein [Dokdonella sp.]|uniref:L,D-transpeptidase family protein n=1 Tax=Dokdonella sp. TaxID=2291710 RepID=UPI0039C88E31
MLAPGNHVLRVGLMFVLAGMVALIAPLANATTDAEIVAGSKQMIVVIAPDWSSSKASLRRFARQGGEWQALSAAQPVVIGKSGSAWGLGLHSSQPGLQKREGDGRAPAGIFAIGPAFGYARSRSTALQYQGMTAQDYCIDVSESLLYNQIVDAEKVGRKAIAGSTEPMRRDLHANGDQRYKLGFVIEHNVQRQPAGGSCIFAHLWKSADSSTAGCTAMTETLMGELLDWLDPSQRPLFILLPRAEYTRLRKAWQLPHFDESASH